MTATEIRPSPAPTEKTSLGQNVVRILTTTDHKLIGKMYLVTSFSLFMIGGLMAMLIRSELAYPGTQIVNDELCSRWLDSKDDVRPIGTAARTGDSFG